VRVVIARIDRIVLRTPDPELLGDFYAEHLGALASAVCVDPDTGVRFRMLDFCGVGIELVEAPAEDRPAEPYPRIAFALGSAAAVDALTARLADAGRLVIEAPRRAPDGCYQSAFLDPDGNRIALTV
jgi:lactoylglutathione lyase